jgi:hypothetical protein
MSGFWPIGYFPKRTSAQRFDEAPKLDSCLGSGTVRVIATPLAFRRAAAFGSRAEDTRAGCPSKVIRSLLLCASVIESISFRIATDVTNTDVWNLRI